MCVYEIFKIWDGACVVLTKCIRLQCVAIEPRCVQGPLCHIALSVYLAPAAPQASSLRSSLQLVAVMALSGHMSQSVM